jgi:RNA polymerase subunit RPABC4/transcription elongation factor Spt4
MIAMEVEVIFPDRCQRTGKMAATDSRLVFIGTFFPPEAFYEGKEISFQFPYKSIGSAQVIESQKRFWVFLTRNDLLGPDGLNSFSVILKRRDRKHIGTIVSIISEKAMSSKSDGYINSQPIANIPPSEYSSSNKGVVFSLTTGKKCPSCGKTMEEEWQACPLCCLSLEPRLCPICKRIMKTEWKMCPFCKAMLSEEKVAAKSLCKKCGKPVKENWKKCPYCATHLQS